VIASAVSPMAPEGGRMKSPFVSRVPMGAAVLALALGIPACSDDDAPSRGTPGTPERVVLPLEGAVPPVTLQANVPQEIHFTVQVPHDYGRVESATLDLEATLDHVETNGASILSVLARRLTRFGPQGEATATGYMRIGTDPSTVCTQGVLYGPFHASSSTMTVTPDTAEANEPTLEIINYGSIAFCMNVTATVDATFEVDAVEIDVVEADCPAPANFAGTWVGTYECGNNCGEPFGGDVDLVVTQNGTTASYVDGGGDHYTGRVCGNQFRFERRDAMEVETGTLTLQEDGTAIKRSTWRYGNPVVCWGDCVDYLTRVP
jgi:hypothetical protein